MKFQDDISNTNTYIHTYVRTYIHTDKPKPICPLLFQSWGHNEGAGVLTTFSGQLTPQSEGGSGRILNSSVLIWFSLVFPARMKKIQSKMILTTFSPL